MKIIWQEEDFRDFKNWPCDGKAINKTLCSTLLQIHLLNAQSATEWRVTQPVSPIPSLGSGLSGRGQAVHTQPNGCAINSLFRSSPSKTLLKAQPLKRLREREKKKGWVTQAPVWLGALTRSYPDSCQMPFYRRRSHR